MGRLRDKRAEGRGGEMEGRGKVGERRGAGEGSRGIGERGEGRGRRGQGLVMGGWRRCMRPSRGRPVLRCKAPTRVTVLFVLNIKRRKLYFENGA